MGNKRIIVTLIAILILIIGIGKLELLQPKPELKLEGVVCNVQDNSNHSNWCEYPCGSNVLIEAIKCQNLIQLKENKENDN